MYQCPTSGVRCQRQPLSNLPPMVVGPRAAALEAASDEALLEAKRLYLDAANVDRRGGDHSTGVRWWIIFRVWGCGATPLPDPRRMTADWQFASAIEDSLEDFAVWLAVFRPSGRQVSAKSISKYVSSVRAWYRRRCRAVLGLGAEGGRVQDILKGYARSVTQPPKLERDGCTPQDLARGMSLALAGQSLHAVMWRALLSVAFTGLMRGCEVALDDARGETFDSEQHLVLADVMPFTLGGVQHVRLRMRKRKDMQVLRGKHDVVVLAGGGRFIDAPAALAEWQLVRAQHDVPLHWPLFCTAGGRMVTVACVRDMVRRCMAAAGRLPERYGAHSLRIGAATAALAAGVEPQRIRLMGRWSSDVYEIYCRMSLQSALAVSTALTSATVDDVRCGFREEHLELQASEVASFSALWEGAGGGTNVGGDE